MWLYAFLFPFVFVWWKFHVLFSCIFLWNANVYVTSSALNFHTHTTSKRNDVFIYIYRISNILTCWQKIFNLILIWCRLFFILFLMLQEKIFYNFLFVIFLFPKTLVVKFSKIKNLFFSFLYLFCFFNF